MSRAVRLTCIAWIAMFAMPLALVLAVKPAHAAVSGYFLAPCEEPEEAGEECEFEEEECAEAEEEFEEGETSKKKLEEACEESGGAGGVLPEECLLRTFRPQLVASSADSKVQLTIRYTTFESTKATVDYGLKALHLGTAKLHLGKSGVLHLTSHLSGSQIAKVLASHNATVQIQVPSTPSHCNRYYSAQLTARHGPHGHVTFAPQRNG